ncbi:MAG: iron-sulfur cluster assembly accessory protein [Dehalococcoidia bacterium]|nr:iron-sulfur cluster assembly accessory protein [Dehalococcoidia bacterium]
MPFTVTDKAAENLLTIVGERARDGQGVRLLARQGGCACSGSSFVMGFDVAQDQDAVIEVRGIRFILDPLAAEKLEGGSIDYVDDVMRKGFAIEAPNAGGGSCGCGGH